VNKALGMALVHAQYAKEGSTLHIEVRGKKLKAEVVKKPFYKKPPLAN
jgi:aminomethyltransferase